MPTYREQFDSAMQCQTVEKANDWMNKEIDRYKTEFGTKAEEAHKIILSNLGYMAGYYDRQTSQKVHDLFGANHPIFGGPSFWNAVTPKEAIEAGMKAAKS